MESIKQIDNEIKDVQIVAEEIQFKNDETTHSEKKKMNELYLSLLILFCLAVIISVFLIGYFCFNWFQKEPNNIVKIEKEQYQVNYYKEKKRLTSVLNEEDKTFKGSTQVEDIDIDFLVIVNLKKRLTYFGTKDYLYNASLLILGTNISKFSDWSI